MKNLNTVTKRLMMFGITMFSTADIAFASGITKVSCRTTEFLVELAYPIGDTQNISGDIRNLATNFKIPISEVKQVNDVINFEENTDNDQGIRIFSILDFFTDPILELEEQDSQIIERVNCIAIN